LKVIPYNSKYKRDHFSCEKESLNNYILRNATKDVKAGACTCFVIINEEEKVIAYYTLAADSIPSEDAPDQIKKQIRYSHISVILLGRLAVDESIKGKGIGKLLLVNALRKSLQVAQDHIGSVAVLVDPIDEDAEQFYTKYGFTRLPDSGRMFMTIRKIQEAFDLASN
jgi:predicted GNAT family N-acyltransferase